jgi:hypothetical protein
VPARKACAFDVHWKIADLTMPAKRFQVHVHDPRELRHRQVRVVLECRVDGIWHGPHERQWLPPRHGFSLGGEGRATTQRIATSWKNDRSNAVAQFMLVNN